MKKQVAVSELVPGQLSPTYNYMFLKKLSDDGWWKVLAGMNIYKYRTVPGVLEVSVTHPNENMSYYLYATKIDRKTCEVETEAEAPDLLEKFRHALPRESKMFMMGTDPEMFLADRTSGRVIPAFNVLKRKKDRAYERLFADGFQAEATVEAQMCLEVLSKRLSEVIQSFGHYGRLRPESTIRFSKRTFAKCSVDDLQFGCEPSENVYGMSGLRIADPAMLPYRFAGGHIHIGCGKEPLFMGRKDDIVAALDKVLGVIGVSLAEGLDSDVRRQFYGLAGEHRIPDHGIEYRVLSNFWLQHPLIYFLCFHLARYVSLLAAIDELKWDATEGEVIESINSNNVGMARAIIERNRDSLKEILEGIFGNSNTVANALFMIENGAGACFTNWPMAVEHSWSNPTYGSWYWRNIAEHKLSSRKLESLAYRVGE